MKSVPVKTKVGKHFRAPSIFLMPKSDLDARVLAIANQRYPRAPGGMSLEQIDGLVFNLKDYREMWGTITQTAFHDNEEIPRRSLADRVKIINPGLEFLLRGNDSDRTKMGTTGLFDLSTIREVNRITSSETSPSDKAEQIVHEVYPKIHAGTINSILRYQLNEEADIIILPTVPITSTRYFDKQIEKATEMIRTSCVLLERLFSGTVNRRDMMVTVTADARFLAERKYVVELAACLFSQESEQAGPERVRPDHVGVAISNLDKGNETQIQNVFDFMGLLYQGMKEQGRVVPLHLLNIDQLGYLAFNYGVSAITMPIAADPYFYSIRHKKDITPPRKGVYYVPSKMKYEPYDKLLELTRSNNYRLPCHCETCDEGQTVFNAETIWDFNEFRKIHDALYKNIENKMLREPRIPFPDAMRDMLSRCRPAWTQYMPTNPQVAF